MEKRFVIASFAVLAFAGAACASAPSGESLGNLLAANASLAKSPSKVCHRVVEQRSHVRVYCGALEQWVDLQARVGFRCHFMDRRTELCATSQEWRRVNFAALSSPAVRDGSSPIYGEAQASTEMNHPVVTFTGTPILGK